MIPSKDRMESFNPNAYNYSLPEDRIAKYPIEKRDESKLLFYNKGEISHDRFNQLPTLIPEGSLLIFNQSKVIPARIIFQKNTGAIIEVMLLNPIWPSNEMNLAMKSDSPVTWHCMVKNLKKWKSGTRLQSLVRQGDKSIQIYAEMVDINKNEVRISWDNPDYCFADIIDIAGKVPLPPYMKREAEAIDKNRYQTVYSKVSGAVAAPTAGLHFTDNTLFELKKAGIKSDYLTLHVSAGTFQPINVDDIRDHNMHAEQVVVTRQNLNQILANRDRIIAVGTTSMRTLESLFWYGVKLIRFNDPTFQIGKTFPYELGAVSLPTLKESIDAIGRHMALHSLEEIIGETEIFIFPGYEFKVCKGLITNFHMPKSTLMLLVAAFVGKDWRKIYQEATDNGYRFLSYGDSSLLLPSTDKLKK